MIAESENILTARAESNIISLACGCGLCRLPYARIEQGGLWIQSRHNGDSHLNRVPDSVILQLAGLILLERMLGGKA